MTSVSLIVGMAGFDMQAVPIPFAVVVLASLLVLSALLLLVLLRMLHVQRRRFTRVDRQRREQAAFARAVLDALPLPVMVKNPQGIYAAVNDAAEKAFGVDAALMIGKTSEELTGYGLFEAPGAPPASQRFHRISMETVQDDAAQRHEIDYTGRDGMPRTGVAWDCPIRLADGSVAGSLGVLMDITAFREAEKHARVADQRLREIARRLPVVAFTLRCEAGGRHRLLFSAGNTHGLLGLDADTLLPVDDLLHDWPLLERVHPDDKATFASFVREAADDMQPRSLDFRVYGEQGLRWIHLVMAPHGQAQGHVDWGGYCIDTTGVNAQNETLRVARDAAEKASKAKADFLATMSHEIRTPMNGVIGMLELLGHTPLDADQRELLQAVEDSASVLLQILNDVLDFSKLEAGNLRLDNEPFDPRMLVDNVVSVMAGYLHGKGLRMRVEIDSSLAGRLTGDSVRLRQILLNLLNNAGKFTEHGSITIRWQVSGDDGSSQHTRLSVTDTGIGIARDKQAGLFTPFSQAESWTARRYGGTGLGLAICRHLVELMDGAVELVSETGQGTCVTVDLRLPIEQREVATLAGLGGRHAIVRLSSAATAAALAGHLTALGLTCEQIPPDRTMRSGMSASLLFVDIEDAAQAPSIPARLVTVSDQPGSSLHGTGEADDPIVLGANPLKWQSVMRACQVGLELPGRSAREASSESIDIPAAGHRLPEKAARGRILVAEDHPVSQQLIRRQLTLLGWPCDVVGNGLEACEALRRGGYAMLISDCNMPLMNGYDLARTWRQCERAAGEHARLPIIAMTANALGDDTARCREAGMDDYLSKPVQLGMLERKILDWLPSPDDGVSPGAEKTVTVVAPATAVDVLSQDIVQLMIETSRDDLAALERAVRADDPVMAGQRLHRMLGALQLFTDAPLLDEGRTLLGSLRGERGRDALPELAVYIRWLGKFLGELEQRD